MYITGLTDQDVNEYSLSTAWDISSASYVQNFSVATEETSPQDLTFKPDGTKMYVVGLTGDDVNEYSLSSAWDISTASYVQNFVLNTTNPLDITFSSDGTSMYTLHGVFAQYSLSTAWDVSSASHVQDYSLAALGITAPNGVYLDATRSVFYVADDTNNRVYAFIIGAFSVATEETFPNDLFFKPDGTKMYVIGQTGDDVNEYDLSTAWDISTASYLQNFSVASQEAGPQDLFFKPDGTTMYVIGVGSDAVNEYSLSVAWDVSSASYVQNFSVAAQDTAPTALFFRSDGTKMYVLGDTGNDVNEYDLSTGWDVSTASYLQNFSVASQETTPQGLSFKTDGTKMYITGTSSDVIHQYDLSSAWDVSSASYVQSVNSFNNNPTGLFFRDTGEEFFIIVNGGDLVLKFTIA
jgi:sugar lactone lactonase YvrE